MYVVVLCAYAYHYSVCGGQRRVLNPLELEFQVTVSHWNGY